MPYRYLLLFILLLNNVSYGEDASAMSENHEGKPPPVKESYQVNTAIWLNALQETMPMNLCAENSFYRSCFDMSTDECAQLGSLITKACSNNAQLMLPENLGAEESEFASRLLGRCIFDLYEKFLEKKKIQSDACDKTRQSLSQNQKD